MHTLLILKICRESNEEISKPLQTFQNVSIKGTIGQDTKLELSNEVLMAGLEMTETRRTFAKWEDKKLLLGLSAPTVILGLIIVLAAVLRFYNFSAVGDGFLYYTAAVKSMLQS